MLDAQGRLIRSIATLKLIDMIVSQFPVYPEAPLERHLMDEKLNVIQTLLSWALTPEPSDEEVSQWDLALDAIGQIESEAASLRKRLQSIVVTSPDQTGFVNIEERYGDAVLVMPADYVQLNPSGSFDVRSDGIYERRDEKWIQIARPIIPGSD